MKFILIIASLCILSINAGRISKSMRTTDGGYGGSYGMPSRQDVQEEEKPEYQASAPSYQKPAPMPTYEAPKPTYTASAPSYQKPAYTAPVKEESRPSSYSAPAPSYKKPAYIAPVEVKSRGYEQQTHQAKSSYGGSSY